LVGDKDKLETLQRIRNLMRKILDLNSFVKDSSLSKPDKDLLEKRRLSTRAFYELFKTKEKKYTTSKDSITMLKNFLENLYRGVATKENMIEFFKKHGSDFIRKSLPPEPYRTQMGGNYKLKYLKYKQKYLELKKSIY
jgi:hypothetical protein